MSSVWAKLGGGGEIGLVRDMCVTCRLEWMPSRVTILVMSIIMLFCMIIVNRAKWVPAP